MIGSNLIVPKYVPDSDSLAVEIYVGFLTAQSGCQPKHSFDGCQSIVPKQKVLWQVSA